MRGCNPALFQVSNALSLVPMDGTLCHEGVQRDVRRKAGGGEQVGPKRTFCQTDVKQKVTTDVKGDNFASVCHLPKTTSLFLACEQSCNDSTQVLKTGSATKRHKPPKSSYSTTLLP